MNADLQDFTLADHGGITTVHSHFAIATYKLISHCIAQNPLLASTGNFTSGNVVATAGLGDNTSMLQISAPVQPGNSGGPLIDEFGNIAGIIASKLDVIRLAEITDDVAQNVNFAIKASVAKSSLESHGLNPPSETSKRRLESVNVAELAKQFTVQVAYN
jgi:hypothetical protein